MEKPKLYRFCEKSVFFASCAAAIVVFVLNILYSSRVMMDRQENVQMSFAPIAGVVILFAVALAIFAALYCRNLIPRIHEKLFFACSAALSLLGMIYLICNVDDTLRADAAMVRDAALGIMDGDYSAFLNEGYMTRYPHQIGLVLYDTILLSITRDAWILFAANALFVCAINYLTWRISDVMFGSKAVNLLTILVSNLFLPQVFFILFAYGLIPGLFFMMAAFYQTLKFTKGYKVRNLVGCALCMAVSIVLKKNYMIAALAIIIFLLFKLMQKSRNWKALIAIAALLVGMFLPNNLLKLYYESKTGGDLDGGIPSVLWLVMGTEMKQSKRGAPGGYDGTHTLIYEAAGYDSEQAAEFGKIGVKHNLKKMAASPLKTIEFFKDKTVYQWTDPLYQSTWSGPLEQTEQYTHTALLRSVYNGGMADTVVYYLSKIVTVLIWLGFGAFLFLKKHKSDEWLLMALFVLGGLIFHTFWEGKSQYIYPYVFSLIPTAMCGVCEIAKKFGKLIKRGKCNE